MTTDTATPGPTDEGSSRPSWLIPVIVIVVIVVLVGGAVVVYKLTKSKSSAESAYTVAHRTVVAIKGGKSPSGADATSEGQAALSKITANDLSGLTLVACKAVSGTTNARVCTWTRPGGQMTMSLTQTGGHWKVTNVTIGSAATTPTSSTTTPPST